MAMVIYLVYLTERKYFYFNVLMQVDNYFHCLPVIYLIYPFL